MKHSAVIFDLDDTLYPEEQFILSGFQAVSKYLCEKYILDSNLYHQMEDYYREGKRGNIFNLIVDQAGISDHKDIVQELVSIYREHMPDITLFEDAKTILSLLSGKVKLGIITDGYASVQRNKVAALGVENMFSKIIFTDDLGREYWKPSPIPYRLMHSYMEEPVSNLVYVADNPAKDFVSPRKDGWLTIQILRQQGQYSHMAPTPDHQPDIKIENLVDLLSLI